jgi:hypothetical protein
MHSVGRRALLAAATVSATTAAMLFGSTATAGATTDPVLDTGLLRTVSQGGDLAFPTGQSPGTPAGIQTPEFPASGQDGAGANRSNSRQMQPNALSPGGVPVVSPTAVGGSPGLGTSFQGLNGFQERYANNGNQFSVEPPDQGLCANGSLVFEVVNGAVRVYTPSGTATSGVTALNAFLGYAPAIDRTTGVYGPIITDPTCLFDSGTNHWFVNVLTLDTDPVTGNTTGTNHLDVAVSKTANPLDGFSIYRLPVQDDGTQGTPMHKDCPCIGDYPHIAADQFGFYVTTNEYTVSSAPGVFGNTFNGAQIYAFDKAALAAGARNLNVVQFSRTSLQQGATTVPGFTLAPAQVPGTAYQTADNGTEYFLDSVAGEEAQPGGFTGQAQSIGVYRLTNTKSIQSAQPALSLSGSLRDSERYVVPPRSAQKNGPTPLASLCSVTDCFGTGPRPQSEQGLDSNDSRMMQVYFANGRLYGALDTGVQINGQLLAGIAWFLVDPGTAPSTSSVAQQGYLGVAGQNVTYPAIAALANGSGAMAYTLVGKDHYPSAAYSLVTATGPTGAVHVAAAGAGPQDGFSEYFPSTADPASAPRPRWGDYGAAVPVGNTIWLASEYIGQTCSFAVSQNDPTCGSTRAPLINWATRISAVSP